MGLGATQSSLHTSRHIHPPLLPTENHISRKLAILSATSNCNSKMFARSSKTVHSVSPQVALTQEVTQTFEAVKENERSARKKIQWCDNLERHVKEVYPSARLVLVGSSRTNFGIEGCDVDLSLVRPQRRWSVDGDDSGISVLRQIQRRLLSRTPSIDAELISAAVVPILKLKDRRELLEGDISVDVTNSLFNTYLQKCYGEMDPRITPLVVTVKYWAKRSGITGARDHKLSGFAVVLLVIYFLQRGCSPPVVPSLQNSHPTYFRTPSSASAMAETLSSGVIPPVVTSYKSENNDSLGQLLAAFFQYYYDFNWNPVLSVCRGGSKPVPISKKWTRPYIRIEDPYDGTNVTRAVYKFDQFSRIKQAFRDAYNKIVLGRGRLIDII